VEPTSLDHVALWVADRDHIAEFAAAHLGMHVIERTDRFTLVGSDARRGKLTLFDAEGPRQAGALQHVALRVRDLDKALEKVELHVMKTRFGYAHMQLPEGLEVVLVAGESPAEVDLDHVAIACEDPAAAAEAWEKLGFRRVEAGPAGGERLEVGGAFIDLRYGSPDVTDRPLLNHLAVLVDSADEWRQTAEDSGFEVADVKDAENTYAVFVRGPGEVVLEYVEHKPSFSLV
jgi:catechol 2,3-dioxygenase-like lactoylglutathione lyase family enzyme